MKNIAILGEVMLEISSAEERSITLGERGCQLSVAGDTYNTAVILSHLGINTSYLTALGHGPLSDLITKELNKHGVNSDGVLRINGREPGLYLIDNDENGERHFTYWRSASAARHALQTPELFEKLLTHIDQHDAFYWSGITLALMSQRVRETFFDFLSDFRAKGKTVYFDSNFRPKLWEQDADIQGCYQQAIAQADLYLPSLEDEQAIQGETSMESILKRLESICRYQAIMTCGDDVVWLHQDGRDVFRLQLAENIVDATGAGDAYSGALIAALFAEKKVPEAINFAHQVATKVVHTKGAILPDHIWDQLPKP